MLVRSILFAPILLITSLFLLASCTSTPQAPKQLISELEARGYVCDKKAPLGSRRQRLICKSPEQIAADIESLEREKAAYIYENPQRVDGVRLY